MSLTRLLYRIYAKLPSSLRPFAKRGYYRGFVRSASLRRLHEQSLEEIEASFVSALFDHPAEYREYRAEFEETLAQTVREEAHARYRAETGRELSSDLAYEAGARCYAMVRARKPEILVETGVCNGFSTLCLLLATRANGTGQLHSIDLPFRVTDSLNDYRRKTYEGATERSAIPTAAEPGWMVPEELRYGWNLVLGKTQRRLPELLADLKSIDFFAHDSEHSVPCMMMEYELAWERLRPGGVIVSDDVFRNDAFETFVRVRKPSYGLIYRGVGFMVKSGRSGDGTAKSSG